MLNKKKSIIFVSLILLTIISLGVLSAADNETVSTDVTPIGETNVEPESNTVKEEVGSFSDLHDLLNSEGYEVSLDRDYAFNKTSDEKYSNGLNLSMRTLIINGNNHVIDAGNTTVFSVYGTYLELNNLTIKNANLAINGSYANVSTNNVMFMNNYNKEYGGAIKLIKSEYTSINDTFKDNYAPTGAAIYSSETTLKIINSSFTNDNELKRGLIYIHNSSIYMDNILFTDIVSNYSTALYGSNSSGYIVNSRFINLQSLISAGAISFKNVNSTIYFDNCTFTNVTSKKNAGAIFIDVDGMNLIENKTFIDGFVIINNSLFNECNSDYGGAIIQLGGTLCVDKTLFNNNYANYDGGAIYTSNCNLSINNSLFEDNTANMNNLGCGGALYFDNKNLIINNTVFKDNLACEGGALYIYDSYYNITQSYFENNDENVHTLFDHEYSNCDDSNNFVNGENIINDKEYSYVYEGIGEKIPINPIELDKKLINASRFDLRDYGLVPTVRHQGYMGVCWAFGATGALESALLLATNKSFSIDISENNIKNNVLYYSKQGVFDSEGSYSMCPASYFTGWLGIVPSNDDTYDELGKIGSVMDNGTKYHIYEFKILFNNNTSNISVYKEALIEHGAISTIVNGDYDMNFNKTTYAHYTINSTKEEDMNHEVDIVGWDDNFSKYNFLTTPPGDGAWIIRNSWGENWADHGYYYLSYYDSAFLNYRGQVVYIVNDTYNFEKNYQYDPISYPMLEGLNGTPVTYANTYESVGDDLIAAVGTFFNESQPYNLSVTTKSGTYNQSGVSNYCGFQLIHLNKYVPVKEFENFTVSITSTKVAITKTRNIIPPNSSYSDYTGTWTDLTKNDSVAILKAYTIKDHSQILVNNMTTTYHSGEYLVAQFIDESNNKLNHSLIEYKLNGKLFNATTDENGFVYIDTNLAPGLYVVSLYNPVNNDEVNVTLVIESVGGNSVIGKHSHSIIKNYQKQVKHTKTYTVLVKNNKVYEGKYITIDTLNKIFNTNFTNGHLTVYIDGILIFNDTITDNIWKIILEITEKYLGTHEIKIEYTNNNKTQTYTENITIT